MTGTEWGEGELRPGLRLTGKKRGAGGAGGGGVCVINRITFHSSKRIFKVFSGPSHDKWQNLVEKKKGSLFSALNEDLVKLKSEPLRFIIPSLLQFASFSSIAYPQVLWLLISLRLLTRENMNNSPKWYCFLCHWFSSWYILVCDLKLWQMSNMLS